MTYSKPLTLGELEDGDYFIVFPLDGDDSGHGGFRRGSYLMYKIREDDNRCYYRRSSTAHNESGAPPTMKVLKVLVL